MKLRAPAKINLFLSVGARSGNGLHELVSVMQAVSLFDEVSIERAPSFALRVLPEGAVPADDSNLAARAARALSASAGVDPGFEITLEKQIPVAAGLAGGSADAAATLVGVNRLIPVPLSRKALERIASAIGSDVPFCVRGGTAIVAGTGSEVTSIPLTTAVWWVLGIGEAILPTAEVYAEFDRLGGGTTGDPHEVADALARGQLERLAASLRNDLEPSAIALRPELEGGRAALAGAGALGVVLSGSGPTWAALARDEDDARAIASRVAPAFARVEVVGSVPHGPRVAQDSSSPVG